jgi:DNA-binding transcriptional MerR regulator
MVYHSLMKTIELTYTIGELAKKTGLTRRALRIYEEAGLLRPQRTLNNYRHYTEQQLREAFVIQKLREVDLPLPIISRLLSIKRAAWPVQQKAGEWLEVLDFIHAELMKQRQAIDTALQQLEPYQCEAKKII